MLHVEIENETRELSGAKPGTAVYIAQYQPAWANIICTLLPSEKDKFGILCEEWNRQGPPEDVRQRYEPINVWSDVIIVCSV